MIPSRDPRIVEVAFLAVVAPHGVEAGRPAVGEHFSRIAHHEQRADRFPFASFAADLDRQIDDDLERVQGNAGFQLPQIAAGEPVKVFVQVDHAQRVGRGGVETAIKGHHARSGGENVVGHGFEHRLGKPFVDGTVGHVEMDGVQARPLGIGEVLGRVARHDYLRLAHQTPHARPIGGAFQQQENGFRLGRFGHPPGHAQKRLELFGETYWLHWFTASPLGMTAPCRPQRRPTGPRIANPQVARRRNPNQPYTTIFRRLGQRQGCHDSFANITNREGEASSEQTTDTFGQRRGRCRRLALDVSLPTIDVVAQVLAGGLFQR